MFASNESVKSFCAFWVASKMWSKEYAVLKKLRLADEDGDEGFFYDEDAAAEGAGGDREALLEHLDSLIQMPRADELDHVQLSLTY